MNNPRNDDKISWAKNKNLILKIRQDIKNLRNTELDVSIIKLINAVNNICLFRIAVQSIHFRPLHCALSAFHNTKNQLINILNVFFYKKQPNEKRKAKKSIEERAIRCKKEAEEFELCKNMFEKPLLQEKKVSVIY